MLVTASSPESRAQPVEAHGHGHRQTPLRLCHGGNTATATLGRVSNYKDWAASYGMSEEDELEPGNWVESRSP